MEPFGVENNVQQVLPWKIFLLLGANSPIDLVPNRGPLSRKKEPTAFSGCYKGGVNNWKFERLQMHAQSSLQDISLSGRWPRLKASKMQMKSPSLQSTGKQIHCKEKGPTLKSLIRLTKAGSKH